ncbi:hypothetical protein C1X72_04255 [Pseudomonas sp. FW306-2-2C-D06B]|jgi:hypothetical protein|nr:hypothetical protein C1X72_04255 [Pseudomonas sp. FW306-2-2C-D06B]PNA99754.1 hypothetical protein C1X74_07795 [Pseudomonas sp. GW460-5]PNB59441.1 hypothetical protein C1X73_11325 [Pseudomonas sp. FW305-130]
MRPLGFDVILITQEHRPVSTSQSFRPYLQMPSNVDFRFTAHRQLLDLEACTSRLMYLVAAGEIHGAIWDDAVVCQMKSHDAWLQFLSQRSQPSLPA